MDDASLTAWLLDSDPALRWQVERDLVEAPEGVWQATRARVATEGMGARLLQLQDADGQWAGGAFFPADFDFEGPEAAEGAGQPWTATTWVLNDLRDFGLDASALAGTAELLDRNARWEYDDLPYWGGEVDVCINAWTLMNGTWLGRDMAALAQWFVDHQQAEGGWNCEWVEGSTRASFHSTLNALRGLAYYRGVHGESDALRAARLAGEEYLLERHLLRRATTGEHPGPWATQLMHPARWVYTPLGALDYFRATSPERRDPRMSEAIEVVRTARQPDGTWLQGRRLPGRVWFDIDVPVGEPSKWITLQALRVLRWWDAATA